MSRRTNRYGDYELIDTPRGQFYRAIPGPIGLALAMADIGIPEKILPALRLAVFWVALPFICFLVGVERIFDHDGRIYQTLICFFAGFASIAIAVYWEWLIPQRWASSHVLGYLHYKDSELGSAIHDMVRRSAWGRWFAAQMLVGNGRPICESELLQAASFNVVEEILNGALTVRGRPPDKLDYEPIPSTHWRSSALHFIKDPATLWKMVLIPRGGAEISPDGTVTGRDPQAIERNAAIANYDSLIVDGYQFEKLWPLRDKAADKARRHFLREAKRRKLDKAEIQRLS